MSTHLNKLLSSHQIEPVIVDVGSSGYAQFDFSDISASSMIIGFDADPRGNDLNFARGFKKNQLVQKILVPDDQATNAHFKLTEYPGCSSLLDPDLSSLREFVFQDYFRVKKTETLPATSLNRVQKEFGIHSFDWLKVDAQGADLQIIKGISKEQFDQILVIELEPGLIDAYKGEDLFGPTHQYLWERDFWLSQLTCQRYPRIAKNRKMGLQGRLSEKTVDKFSLAPTCAEVRYHRTLKYYENPHVTAKRAILGYTFALVDKQLGHALELAEVISRKDSSISKSLLEDVAANYVQEKSHVVVPTPQNVFRSKIKKILESASNLLGDKH